MASKVFRLINANGVSNLTPVKLDATTLQGLLVTNIGTTTCYLKLYNADAAGPTVGTTLPTMTIRLVTGATVPGTFIFPASGVIFTKGLWMALTVASADTDVNYAITDVNFFVHLFYE